MDRLDDKAMANNQALETLCFLCWCAPVATGITQIHFEMGGGKTNRSDALSSLYGLETDNQPIRGFLNGLSQWRLGEGP